MIIIVFGLPGSGKSFFAFHLANSLNAKYLNTDQVRREMYANRTYSTKEKMTGYDVMLEKTREAVEKKIDLVLDGTFYKKTIRRKFQNEVGGKDAIQFIEVIADENSIRARLAKPRILSEADLNIYKKIKNEWEPMREHHLIINSTNENIEKMMKEAEDYLYRHDK